MGEIKFELTSESIVNVWGVTLFRIKATVDIKERNVKKGDLGGFVESTHLDNGNARVSGNARLTAKAGFKAGWFIGGDDTQKITRIEDKTGSGYWKAQYVLGDYEIEDLEESGKVSTQEEEIIELNGKKYKLVEELSNE